MFYFLLLRQNDIYTKLNRKWPDTSVPSDISGAFGLSYVIVT